MECPFIYHINGYYGRYTRLFAIKRPWYPFIYQPASFTKYIITNAMYCYSRRRYHAVRRGRSTSYILHVVYSQPDENYCLLIQSGLDHRGFLRQKKSALIEIALLEPISM